MWTEHSSRPEGRTGTAGGCSGRTSRRTHSVREGDVCAHTAARSSPADISGQLCTRRAPGRAARSGARGTARQRRLVRRACRGVLRRIRAPASRHSRSPWRRRAAEHWADDTVILVPRPGGVEALSLPFPARVDHDVRAHVRGAGRSRLRCRPGNPRPLAAHLPAGPGCGGRSPIAHLHGCPRLEAFRAAPGARTPVRPLDRGPAPPDDRAADADCRHGADV